MTNAVEEVFFTRQQTADYIGRSVSTLATWAQQKNPKIRYVKNGHDVKYRKSDCDEYCNDLQRI